MKLLSIWIVDNMKFCVGAVRLLAFIQLEQGNVGDLVVYLCQFLISLAFHHFFY